MEALVKIAEKNAEKNHEKKPRLTPDMLKDKVGNKALALPADDGRARVRYEYGLTNITEVAEAQSLLARAEIDDAVAKLAVWRALLVAAKLQGDLQPFIEQAGKK